MKKILLTASLILSVFITANESYAEPALTNLSVFYAYNQSNQPVKVKTVNVYKFAYGKYVSDGKCDIYKNAQGFLYLKSNVSNSYYPVCKTQYPHSQYFKNFAQDQWGYTVYFNL